MRVVQRRELAVRLPEGLVSRRVVAEMRNRDRRASFTAAEVRNTRAFDPALQGRNVSSRGQRPRKTAHPSPPSPLPVRTERGAAGGVRGWLPMGFTHGYPLCSPSGSTERSNLFESHLIEPVASSMPVNVFL